MRALLHQHRAGLGDHGFRPLPPVAQGVQCRGSFGAVRRQRVRACGQLPDLPADRFTPGMVLEPRGDNFLHARRQRLLPGERLRLCNHLAVARHVERLGRGLARLPRLPVHLLRQPPECPAAVVSQGVPGLLRRLPDTRALARHGIQVGRVDVFRAQHVPGHDLQCTAFLAPGAARWMFRIEPAGLVLRQVRTAFPPRRDTAGQGAHLFRQRHLRRIDLPPFRHRVPYMRIDPLGGLESFARLRHLPVARRMQLRDAALRGPFAKRVPRPFEAFGIVEEPRAFEHPDGLFQAGVRSRHGMEMACRLALHPEPGPARLQKRRDFLAPGIVFGKLLDGQSLRGGRPAELRPAPPVVAHALDEAAHLAVTHGPSFGIGWILRS